MGGFAAHASGYTVHVLPGELLLSFDRSSATAIPEAIRITLRGANKGTAIASDPLPGVVHYYAGADPGHWRTDVHRFRQVRFPAVYPGIDLVFYGNEDQIEFDFDVAPGRDVSAISLQVDGAMLREFDGNLELVTPSGRTVALKKPALYQLRGGTHRPVRGGYRLRNAHEAGFFAGPYDRRLPLVIDPALVYSTLVQNLLGTNGGELDLASAIAVDSTGAAYVTGFVNDRAYVIKLDPTGSTMVYKTILGRGPGLSRSDAITVDAAGNAYVVGIAADSNFPVTTGVFSAVSACLIGGNIGSCVEPFAVKLDATGKLVFSTYLVQPTSLDTAGPIPSSIAVDATGALYIAGGLDDQSASTPSTIPALTPTAGAFQTTKKSNRNMFAMKLHPDGSAVDYATYIGGSTAEQFGGMAIDSTGVAYIGGGTTSTDFPTTPDAFQTQNPGVASAFFLKLKNDGTGLLYSTYLGAATNKSQAFAIAVDGSNAAYLTGETDGPGFPTTPGVFRPSATGPAPGPVGSTTYNYTFVSKFDAAGALAFSTYLGESAFLSTGGKSMALDSSGVYLTGLTKSPTFPSLGSLAPQFGNFSMFLTKLNLTGSALVFSTFFDSDQVITEPFPGSIALDGAQNVYVTGSASAFQPFFAMAPTTAGAFQPLPLFFAPGFFPQGSFVAKFASSLGAAVPVLIPRSANLAILMNNSDKPPFTVQLSNFGDADLTLGTMTLSGPNAIDFTQLSTCGAVVPSGGECTVGVGFAYNDASSGPPRSATLNVNFGGGQASQSVALIGPSGTPSVHLFLDEGIIFPQITTFDFGAVALGTQSTAVFATFNLGDAPALLQQASATGDFSASIGAALLQPGGPPVSPIVSSHLGAPVTFRPTAAGPRSGQFILQDASLNSPHIVQLTGTGVTDFSLSAVTNANQSSVRPGDTGTFRVLLASAAGFTGSGSFSCGGLPAGAGCQASPAGFIFSGTAGTQDIGIRVTTTGFFASLLKKSGGLGLTAAMVFGAVLLASPRKRRRARLLFLACLLTIATLLASCGGGGGGGGGGTSTGPPGETPPGTFPITVTATSGGINRSAVVILVVR